MANLLGLWAVKVILGGAIRLEYTPVLLVTQASIERLAGKLPVLIIGLESKDVGPPSE